MTKSKPKPVKPVLAWCVYADGELLPAWTSYSRRFLVDAGMEFGTYRIIRVEIRPAPKRKSKRTKP